MSVLCTVYLPTGASSAFDIKPDITASQLYALAATKFGLEDASKSLFQLWIETDESFGTPFGGRPISDSEVVLIVLNEYKQHEIAEKKRKKKIDVDALLKVVIRSAVAYDHAVEAKCKDAKALGILQAIAHKDYLNGYLMPQAKKDDELDTIAKLAALQFCLTTDHTVSIKDVLKKETKEYLAPYIVKKQSVDKWVPMITEHHEAFVKHERKMQYLLYLSIMRRVCTYGCLFVQGQYNIDKKSIKATIGVSNQGIYVIDNDRVDSLVYTDANLAKNGTQQSFYITCNGSKHEFVFPDGKWIADIPFQMWGLLKAKANDIQKAIEKELDAMKTGSETPDQVFSPVGTPDSTIGAVMSTGDAPEVFDEAEIKRKIKQQKKAELLARQERLQELEKQLESLQQQLAK